MKKYVLISDFNINESNRGTAALGYGAVSFLVERGFLKNSQIICDLSTYKNPFKKRNKSFIEEIEIQNTKYQFLHYKVNILEYKLFLRTGVYCPFSGFGKFLKQLSCVATINGGDGFSDIYGDSMFLMRLPYTFIAMKADIPLVILPQTIGPFKNPKMENLALKILHYAKNVFVRDLKYCEVLGSERIPYELTKDLSAYMMPEPFDITISEGAVGINVSGLAYYNNYQNLKGRTPFYSEIIEEIIKRFQEKNVNVYLIPHSYCYSSPEPDNDDLSAIKALYSKLSDKKYVHVIDKDLKSPQIKYIISKMSFFCGTRMHANFAAIYTGIPVFGLAYSFKFAGAFEANGLSSSQTCMITDLRESDINAIVEKVMSFYNSSVQ